METLSTYFQPFFDWLLRSTFQASIVVCLILLIQGALRSRLTARWHYALWLILVIRMILPWAPQSRFSIFNLATLQSKSNAPTYVISELDAESPSASGESSPTQQDTLRQEQNIQKDVTTVAVTSDVPSRSLAADPKAWPEFWLHGMLPFLWLTGALLLGGYIVICNLKLWRAACIESPSTDKEMLVLLEECRSEIGLRTIVALVPSNKVNTPILLGFVRPRLLMPKSITKELTREELRYVLLHELAHVKRHDIVLGWLTALLQVLHWFNPLVWLAFHRMRSNRELACDAMVLSHTQGEETQDYGRAIVSLLEHFSIPQPLPGLAGVLESKSQLKRRIAMITQFKKNSYQWSPLAVILIITLGCVSLPNAKLTKAAGISTAKSGLAGDVKRTGVVIKELDIQYYTGNFGGFDLSWDGSKLVYCKQEEGIINLMVRNLVSGEETQITDYATGYACYPVFSFDGSEIIYSHAQHPGACPLHIISLQTGENRTTVEENGLALDWSRDGRFVLVRNPGDGTKNIMLIDGKVTEKKDLLLPERLRQHDDLRFSPDSKYLSFARDGNLYLFPIYGGEEIQITKGSHGDVCPIWSSDGKELIFLSRQRFGPELDLCGVPIVDSKAIVDVRIILPDFGDNVRLDSLSETGRLLYQRILRERNIYTVAVDPQTGQPIGEPVKLSAGTHPVWSPDGNRIAYLTNEQTLLRVMSADGSVDQEIMEVHCAGTDTYAWAHGDDHIYMVDYLDARRGIYAISISTKEKRPVLVDQSVSHLTCSPDGKWLAFIKSPASGGRNQVFIIDVDGTNLRQLTFIQDGTIYYPAWSPDGKQIAFEYGPGGGIRTLTAISVDEGTTKEVFRGNNPDDRFLRKTWSPDGNKIAWRTWGGIRIGQVLDGKYNTFKVEIDDLYGPSWSPNGSRMLFGTWVDDEQLMIMDNFLLESTTSE